MRLEGGFAKAREVIIAGNDGQWQIGVARSEGAAVLNGIAPGVVGDGKHRYR